MSIMRPMLTAFAIVALPPRVPWPRKSRRPPARASGESFETVKKEYNRLRKHMIHGYSGRVRDGQEERQEEKDIQVRQARTGPAFSPRFLAIAEKNPEGPEAIDALKMTLQDQLRLQSRHRRSKRGQGHQDPAGLLCQPSRRSRASQHPDAGY